MHSAKPGNIFIGIELRLHMYVVWSLAWYFDVLNFYFDIQMRVVGGKSAVVPGSSDQLR